MFDVLLATMGALGVLGSIAYKGLALLGRVKRHAGAEDKGEDTAP